MTGKGGNCVMKTYFHLYSPKHREESVTICLRESRKGKEEEGTATPLVRYCHHNADMVWSMEVTCTARGRGWRLTTPPHVRWWRRWSRMEANCQCQMCVCVWVEERGVCVPILLCLNYKHTHTSSWTLSDCFFSFLYLHFILSMRLCSFFSRYTV